MIAIWVILVLTPALIVYGIYKLFKKDADKKGLKTNWLAISFSSLPFILFFGFFLMVYLHGVSEDFDPYDNHPSIYDEDWQKDNSGGTEIYENNN